MNVCKENIKGAFFALCVCFSFGLGFALGKRLHGDGESACEAGRTEQAAAEPYTESRIDVERLDGTNKSLERAVSESADIFSEIRAQNQNP